MTRIVLDLDKLVPELPPIVTLDGIDYEVRVATPETYTKLVRARQQLTTLSEQDEAGMMEGSMTLISIAIPKVSMERLNQLHLIQLQALVDLVTNEMEKAFGQEESEGTKANDGSDTGE